MLDPRSIIFILSALCFLMSCVLFAMPASVRERLNGTRQWSAGMLTLSITALLFGLRGIAPDWLSISLANAAALSAVGLIYAGGRAFFGKRPANKRVVLTIAIATLVMNYLTYVHESFALRSMIYSLVSATLLYLFFRDVIRYRPRTEGRALFPYIFTGCSLAVDVVVSLFRAVALFWVAGETTVDLFTPSTLNIVYFSTYSLVTICISVGFILMSNERLHALLEHQLSHDSLTNAFARHVVLDLARRELGGRAPVSLLLLDIDHFKSVNDSLGHQAGDEVLKHFVHTLSGSLRPNEPLGRYGGEEFLVLLRDANARQAGVVAERLRRAVSSTPYSHNDSPYPITVSIGCASALPGENLETLLNRADTALYRAKREGRNRVEHG